MEVEPQTEPESEAEEMEEEPESLLGKAFAVDEDNLSDFDPTEIPTNGHEYLAKVIFEAKNCPQVVVADVNNKKFSKQTYSLPRRETYQIPPSYRPSQEWQMQQMEAFGELRFEISQLKQFENIPEATVKKIPKNSASDSWYKFLFGTPTKSSEPEPNLSDMLELNQWHLSNLLSHFDRWFEEGKISFDKRTCLWLYSILACLEEPILPVTCACIRSLSCHASKSRANIVNPDDEMLTRVNLIICLVGRYFKQTDLADEY